MNFDMASFQKCRAIQIFVKDVMPKFLNHKKLFWSEAGIILTSKISKDENEIFFKIVAIF